MVESIEERTQKALDKGKADALAGKNPCIRDFVDTASVQKYFSGFGEGEAERKGVNGADKRLYVLLFTKGLSDANAGHRPAVFGGAYIQGYNLITPHQSHEQNSEFDYINEIRWEYDLPPISKEDLIEDE